MRSISQKQGVASLFRRFEIQHAEKGPLKSESTVTLVQFQVDVHLHDVHVGGNILLLNENRPELHRRSSLSRGRANYP